MISKRFILGLTAVITFGTLSARELTVVEHKDKYGYADENGKTVIKEKFTRAYPFQNGLAKVCVGNKWGYINEDGKAVIPIVYDNIEPFENGIARVKKGNKYGYIKDDGSVYIKPEYNFIGSFNEDGWLWVGKGKTLSEAQKGLYHNDKLIIKPSGMTNYLGFYVKTDSIDYTDGSPISTKNNIPENNEITNNFCRLSISNEPYIWAKAVGTIFQVFDLNGRLLAKQQNGAIGMPKDGYSITRSYSKKKDNQFYKFNYISADGKSKKLFKADLQQKLDPQNIYEGCLAFNNGYALCSTGETAYIINTSGNQISNSYDDLKPLEEKGYISKKGDLYGFLSESGKDILSPKYSMIYPSLNSSGIYAAKDTSSKKYGYIDINGNEIIPFRFEFAIGFTDGKAYIKENGLFGVVDTKGNYIVKNKWKDILPSKEKDSDFIWVQDMTDNKWKCLQISQDALRFDKGFDNADNFDSKGRAIIESDGVYGAVSTDGKTILPTRFMSLDIARNAMKQLDVDGKEIMTEPEAYRFNIYSNKDRHKYNLNQNIDNSMWDF